MKVGMDDPSSVEFVERRRAGLERQVSLHVPVTVHQKTGPIFLNVQTFSELLFTPLYLISKVLRCHHIWQVSPENRVSPIVTTRSRCPRVLGERRRGYFQIDRDLFISSSLDLFALPDRLELRMSISVCLCVFSCPGL